MRRIGFAAAFSLLILAGCAQDEARLAMGTCGARDVVARTLGQLGEEPTGAGINRERGEIVELWQGAESWTVVTTNQFGASCLVSAGQGWRTR